MKRIIITLCICTAWVASTYAQYPYTLKNVWRKDLQQLFHTYHP